MSYKHDLDGQVTFTCNGCKREAQVDHPHQLPAGWSVVGVLEHAADPETETSVSVTRTEASPEDLHEIGALIGAHYHNEKCGLRALKHPKVARLIERLKIALALYYGCIIVVDGTGGDVGVGRSVAHDAQHAAQEKDPSKKPGKPPPFTLGEGGGPSV